MWVGGLLGALVVVLVPGRPGWCLTFSGPISIDDVQDAHCMALADVDQDGDGDVLIGTSNGEVLLWRNQPHIAPLALVFSIEDSNAGVDEIAELKAVDFDGDGDPDLVLSHYWVNDLGGGNPDFHNELLLLDNLDGHGSFELSDSHYNELPINSLAIADFDNDEDGDIVFDDGDLCFIRNLAGTFGSEELIRAGNFATCLAAGNFDCDNDDDIVMASQFEDLVAWFRNTDGDGSFGRRISISTAGDGANWVQVARVNADAIPDLLSFSEYDRELVYFDNATCSWWPAQVLISQTQAAVALVDALDVDVDGDTDLFLQNSTGSRFKWLCNTSGQGTFQTYNLHVTEDPGIVETHAFGDLEGDGDSDLAFCTASQLYLLVNEILPLGAPHLRAIPGSTLRVEWESLCDDCVYKVYRLTNPYLDLSQATLLGTTNQRAFVDSSYVPVPRVWYRVTASH
ncbi:MAG: VCBS repeat-containing protein [Candidatus Delongbacteria bacterium]